MSAKVLQLVNSSFFGLPRPYSSPEEAAVLLGVDTLRSLILGAHIFTQFEERVVPELPLASFWTHSIRVSRVAKAIAVEAGAAKGVAVHAATAGLLHDIGVLAIAVALPAEFRELMAIAGREGNFLAAESKVLGVTHAQAGAYLMGLWGLPDPIVEAILLHHSPLRRPSRRSQSPGGNARCGCPVPRSPVSRGHDLRSVRGGAGPGKPRAGVGVPGRQHHRIGRAPTMTARILLVDDEVNVLQSYQRTLRREFSRLELATGGAQALEMMAKGDPFAVIVSDMRMPSMDGVVFLAKAREAAPRTVRMMLTGNSDLDTAIRAVREGHIFRFLTKPCSSEMLAEALRAGVEQYRLVMAEVELLEKTLSGSVRLLTDLLSLLDPESFGRTDAARATVRSIWRGAGPASFLGTGPGHHPGSHRERHPSSCPAGQGPLREGPVSGGEHPGGPGAGSGGAPGGKHPAPGRRGADHPPFPPPA